MNITRLDSKIGELDNWRRRFVDEAIERSNRNCKHELETAIDAIDHLIKLPFSLTLSDCLCFIKLLLSDRQTNGKENDQCTDTANLPRLAEERQFCRSLPLQVVVSVATVKDELPVKCQEIGVKRSGGGGEKDC